MQKHTSSHRQSKQVYSKPTMIPPDFIDDIMPYLLAASILSESQVRRLVVDFAYIGGALLVACLLDFIGEEIPIFDDEWMNELD